MSEVKLTDLSDTELVRLAGRINAEFSDRRRQRDEAFREEIKRSDVRNSEITGRRFGRDHARSCRDPSVTTCAKWQCQAANRCCMETGRTALNRETDQGERRGEG